MRKILHFDLDAFFCAVEEQRDPSLKGKAFAVGGRPENRGVVASCSYPARRFGVHSAMPMSLAVRRCPGLLVVPAAHASYSSVSQRVMALLREQSDVLEQLSIDEAFLDVSHCPEPAAQLARGLQQRVADELHLPASLGVATNKLVAKIATDVGKSAVLQRDSQRFYPRSVHVVPPGREAAFLAPLPVKALWGVGPKTAERMSELGLETIGDIVRFPEYLLIQHFGKNGEDLHRRARGEDERAVTDDREIKSISQENTFSRDIQDEDRLQREVRSQAESIARRLRKHNVAASTIKLKLRWPDFTTLSRQTTLPQPTDASEQIATVALQLLQAHRPAHQPVRLIGVGVSGLGPLVRQMTLFDVPGPEEDQLNDIVWSLRKRFGDSAVRRASELDR